MKVEAKFQFSSKGVSYVGGEVYNVDPDTYKEFKDSFRIIEDIPVAPDVEDVEANYEQLLERVELVVPVYGQHYYLDKLLKSVPNAYRVWLIDDASPQEDTKKYMQKVGDLYQNVRYRTNPKNKGFAYSVNRGVRMTNSEYVCILNSDVEFVKDPIPDCIEKMDADKDIGVMGIRLLYEDNTLQHGGVVINWDKGGHPDHRWQGVNGFEPKTKVYEETFGVTAAFWMVRRDVWNELGGLSYEYGRGYYEDPDFVCRLRQAGYKAMYNGNVWAYHYGNKSFQNSDYTYDKNKAKYKKFLERNLDYLKKEWK
jgi:GT2 family glycosyltransferase